ncbi:MAG: CopG family transcriptional regulator [Cyanobacteria bacterium P01_F01_bin.116]
MNLDDVFAAAQSKPPVKKENSKTPKVESKDAPEPKPQVQSDAEILADILAPTDAPERNIRFTADLPESLHRRLTMAAATSGKRKVDIVRAILDAVLPQVSD